MRVASVHAETRHQSSGEGLDWREGAGTVIGSHLLVPVPAKDLGEDKKSCGETWGQRADITGLSRIKASWGESQETLAHVQQHHRSWNDSGARAAERQPLDV